MKDIKSIAIGFLSCICLLFIMGQTSSHNIKAKSITIVNDAGDTVLHLGSHKQGGFVTISTNHEDTSIYLGINDDENSELLMRNKTLNNTVFLGSAKNGDGRLVVSDASSNQNVFVGCNDGEGFVATTNSKGETTDSMPKYKSK